VSEPSSPSPSDSAVARWAERLARFSTGGLSVAAFCAAEGISTSKFYHWRNRLARSARPTAPPLTAPPVIVPLRVTPPSPATATPFELVMPSGAFLRFPHDTPTDVLVAVVRGLEARPC
jgi:hypothetical protein